MKRQRTEKLASILRAKRVDTLKNSFTILYVQFNGSSLFSMECGAHQSTKSKIPSSKEAPNLKLQTKARAMWRPSRVALRFGAWNFSGAWSLGFEASQASYSTENSEEPFIPPKTAKTQSFGYCSPSVIRNTRLMGNSLTSVCLLPDGQSTSTASTFVASPRPK